MEYEEIANRLMARIVKRRAWDYRAGKYRQGFQLRRFPKERGFSSYAVSLTPVFWVAGGVEAFVMVNTDLYEALYNAIQEIPDEQAHGIALNGFSDSWKTYEVLLALMWDARMPLWELRDRVFKYLIKRYSNGIDIFVLSQGHTNNAFAISQVFKRLDQCEGPLDIMAGTEFDAINQKWIDLKNALQDQHIDKGNPCLQITEILEPGWHLRRCGSPLFQFDDE